jgi:hypothetical protein
MDPYIEASDLWEDFHDNLIGDIHRSLSETVPDRYAVRLGERSYIVLAARDRDQEPESPAAEHRVQADVAITSRRADEKPSPAAGPLVLQESESEAPVSMRALVETEYRENFVEIIELHPQRRLITTIEVLSPSNKRLNTPGWFQYSRKRQAHLEGNANFVEIDLLRGGHRMPMEDAWPASPYYLLVSRREQAPVCTVWPAHFVRPLPPIPVPLAPPDSDVPLEIQRMIVAIYRRSRYERSDYGRHTSTRDPARAGWGRSRHASVFGGPFPCRRGWCGVRRTIRYPCSPR